MSTIPKSKRERVYNECVAEYRRLFHHPTAKGTRRAVVEGEREAIITTLKEEAVLILAFGRLFNDPLPKDMRSFFLSLPAAPSGSTLFRAGEGFVGWTECDYSASDTVTMWVAEGGAEAVRGWCRELFDELDLITGRLQVIKGSLV